VQSAKKLKKPVNPIKDGYTFKGWSSTREGKTLWNFTQDTMPNNDMTLYAIFEQTYNINYDTDGLIATVTSEANKKLKGPTNPQKEGYRFKGWFTEREGGRQWNFSRDLMPDKDMTLYARFTKLKEPKAALNKPMNTEMQEKEVASEDIYLMTENDATLIDITVEEIEDVL